MVFVSFWLARTEEGNQYDIKYPYVCNKYLYIVLNSEIASIV